MNAPVAVTQADRDAAAGFYASRPFGNSKAHELAGIMKRECEGNVDALVYILARHRLAALEATPARSTGEETPADMEAVAEAIRCVEYDMLNRYTGRGDGFVGERKEVVTIIEAYRFLLQTGEAR